jgi:error-prone DNA polymerase
MSLQERLAADFHGTGLSLGPHPMAYYRPQLPRSVKRAIDLKQLPHGSRVRVAGSVIVRQRPGTAKGFIFLSLEDETGIANVIIVPKLYKKTRLWVTGEKYLLVEGIIQNVDSVVHVKARTLQPLKVKGSSSPSRDFH